jgi:PAS domain S-box-containing protein
MPTVRQATRAEHIAAPGRVAAHLHGPGDRRAGGVMSSDRSAGRTLSARMRIRGYEMQEFHDVVRAVFNQVQVIAWAIDNDGKVLLAEGSPLQGIGFQPGQMVGHNLLEVFGREPKAVEQVKRALAGETFSTEGMSSGRILVTRYTPMRDAAGVQIGVVGVTTDETEHRAATDALAARTAVLSEQAELLDLAHDAIMMCRRDGTITYWNRGAERIHGHTAAGAIGKNARALLRTGLPVPIAEIERALADQGYWEGELTHTRDDGSQVITSSRWVLRRGQDGAPDTVLQIDTDVTARKRAEQAEAERQQDIIRIQAQAIEELSTPLIPITDEILVMPLIGLMDSMRAKQIMENLLSGLAASRGKFAIIDITGVQVVDTAVASALLKAAHAARLLGTQVILTGIRPEVAQTLVHIEANLSTIVTCGTLQAGIQYAVARGRTRLGG